MVIGLLVLLNLAWLNLWIQLSPIGFLETQSGPRIICIIYGVFSNSRKFTKTDVGDYGIISKCSYSIGCNIPREWNHKRGHGL